MNGRFMPLLIGALAILCLTAPKSVSGGEAKAGLSAMPEAVTSFGAATLDGWLYVFGGHKGERHEYSADKVIGSFYRLNLSDGREWEKLPPAAAGQGLALVAHGKYVYRIGGMAARNPAGAKRDLYSTNLVQRFSRKTGVWEDVASLPESRSSHDAVIIGEKIFVAGGWQLTGGTNQALWPKTALALDLKKPEAGWRVFPQPFQRRALALAAIGSRVFCIGGMNSDNEATLEVDIYDTRTGKWSEGPNLPPGKHKGFSCSAITQDGKIYVSAFKGDLLTLASDEQSWEVVGGLQKPRMAHRLVAVGKSQVLALGGEDGDEKRPELELLTPTRKIANETASTTSAVLRP